MIAFTAKVLDDIGIVPDQHVLLERFDGLIRVELRTAVVAFGAIREHLEHDDRVQQGFAFVVGETRLVADHRYVRVTETGWIDDVDARVGAAELRQVIAQGPIHIANDEAVPRTLTHQRQSVAS